jgi:hypothetical protein
MKKGKNKQKTFMDLHQPAAASIKEVIKAGKTPLVVQERTTQLLETAWQQRAEPQKKSKRKKKKRKKKEKIEKRSKPSRLPVSAGAADGSDLGGKASLARVKAEFFYRAFFSFVMWFLFVFLFFFCLFSHLLLQGT